MTPRAEPSEEVLERAGRAAHNAPPNVNLRLLHIAMGRAAAESLGAAQAVPAEEITAHELYEVWENTPSGGDTFALMAAHVNAKRKPAELAQAFAQRKQ